MKLTEIDRPLYKGLTTDDEKVAAMMAEVSALQTVNPSDGMDFSHKTSQWIAFERAIESSRREPDDDRLFNDFLAQHLCEPYGKRLSDAFSFGLRAALFFESGLGDEGHVMYTAARTKLINDRVTQWLQQQQQQSQKGCQILNLGAGLDTRAFWLESLHQKSSHQEDDDDDTKDAVVVYWEVDTAPVLNYKQGVLDALKAQGDLPDPLCPRKVVTMDFSKDSILSLPPKHGFPPDLPTCWILEG